MEAGLPDHRWTIKELLTTVVALEPLNTSRGEDPERELADKRADYFAAGTLVVWDVDILSDAIVRVYRAATPTQPTVYRRGDRAKAEPAVPGWSMAVDDLFPYRTT